MITALGKKINKTTKASKILNTVKATIEVDQFDKTKIITTDNWLNFGIDKLDHHISGNLISVDDLTVFAITYDGNLGCMAEHSTTLKVKLTNGKIIEFSQISNTDCGRNASAKFMPLKKEQIKDPNFKNLMIENLTLLEQYDWEAIRIKGSEHQIDIKPNLSSEIEKPEQFFRQHLIAADQI